MDPKNASDNTSDKALHDTSGHGQDGGMALPPMLRRDAALFLDFDGTLADIAPRPDAVTVEPALLLALERLHELLGGAVAIVTGRPHEEILGFLHPLDLPGAYEHGAARRHANGEQTRAPEPPLASVRSAAQALVDKHPALLVEQKTAGVALHYRQAPELEAELTKAMRDIVEQDSQLQLLHGKAVLEIKSAHVGKGKAIAAFMEEPPFSGRVPVFAGDDVTDESGFESVQRQGGLGIKIGEGQTAALHRVRTPAALRQWLQDNVDYLEKLP